MYDSLVGKRCSSRLLASETVHAANDGNEKLAKRARRTTDGQLHTLVHSEYPGRMINRVVNAPSSSATVVRHTPSQSVYHDEGLFVHIASFCDHRTTIRFCTVTKSYCKSRSRLIGKVLYRADSNATKPKCDPINPSTKESLLLGHTYAHRKSCTNEVASNKDDKENKDVTDQCQRQTNTCSLCGEKPKPSTAGGEFLDGQELIDALMLRVTFDLRWIPTPCPILPWGRKY